MDQPQISHYTRAGNIGKQFPGQGPLTRISRRGAGHRLRTCLSLASCSAFLASLQGTDCAGRALACGQTGVSQRAQVGFLRSRPPDTPPPHHRDGIAWERGRPARILSLWPPLSFSAMLQAATLSAGTASARPKESHGAVPGRSKWGRWPRLCQAWCGRDARAPRKPSSHDIVTPRVKNCRCILVPLVIEGGSSVFWSICVYWCPLVVRLHSTIGRFSSNDPHGRRGLDSRTNGSFPKGASGLSEKSPDRHPPPHSRDGIAWERGRPARILSLSLPLSFSAMLQAATLSARTAAARPKETHGAVPG